MPEKFEDASKKQLIEIARTMLRDITDLQKEISSLKISNQTVLGNQRSVAATIEPVICVEIFVGNGTEEHPGARVKRYFTKEGVFIGETR